MSAIASEAPEREEKPLGIYPTDMGTILGVNPYKTPYQLWREKTGLDERPDISDAPHIHWGKRLEDVICDEYAERENVVVHRVNIQQTWPGHEWIRGYLDRRVVGQSRVLEAKSAGAWMRNEWGPDHSDDFPPHYHCQLATYMAMMNYDQGDLAVLIGGSDFRVYHTTRNFNFEQAILEAAIDFYERCTGVRPPPPPLTLEDINLAHPEASEDIIEATDDLLAEVQRLRGIRDQLDQLQAAKEAIELRIRKAIGDGVALAHQGTALASWKNQSTTRLDSKAVREGHPDVFEACSTTSSYRVLRVK